MILKVQTIILTLLLGSMAWANPTVDNILNKMEGKWSGEKVEPVPFPIQLQLTKALVEGSEYYILSGKYKKQEAGQVLEYRVKFSKNFSQATGRPVYLMEIDNVSGNSNQTLVLTDVLGGESKELVFWTSGLESGGVPPNSETAWGYKISFEDDELSFAPFSGQIFCKDGSRVFHCGSGYSTPYRMKRVTED